MKRKSYNQSSLDEYFLPRCSKKIRIEERNEDSNTQAQQNPESENLIEDKEGPESENFAEVDEDSLITDEMLEYIQTIANCTSDREYTMTTGSLLYVGQLVAEYIEHIKRSKKKK
ncbi:hypothetical protein AKO1_004670 [Acrasis kona]|uniref:Uncharacterized protein n=1 Tax=Acrasis kona TaxID=1008807 RepID=A0AAW2Z2S1_9EUKA